MEQKIFMFEQSEFENFPILSAFGGEAGLFISFSVPRKRKKNRCGRESNPRISVLQTDALPLGHRTKYFNILPLHIIAKK